MKISVADLLIKNASAPRPVLDVNVRAGTAGRYGQFGMIRDLSRPCDKMLGWVVALLSNLTLTTNQGGPFQGTAFVRTGFEPNNSTSLGSGKVARDQNAATLTAACTSE